MDNGISIIVPIYNTPVALLKHCLNSFLKFSDFVSFEFILVDDGSTQIDTSEVAKSYLGKDYRFRYLYQENAGVSSARNYGIQESKFSWLTFVDPDDYLVFDSQNSNIVEQLANSQLNLILFPFSMQGKTIFFDNATKKLTGINLIEVLLNLDEETHAGISTLYASTCWGKLFRREQVIENGGFPEGIFKREDVLFNSSYFLKAERVELSQSFLYDYNTKNDQSISHKYSPKLLENYVDVATVLNHLIAGKFRVDFRYYLYNLLHEALTLDVFHPENHQSFYIRKKKLAQAIQTIDSVGPLIKPQKSKVATHNKYLLYLFLYYKKYRLIQILYWLKR